MIQPTEKRLVSYDSIDELLAKLILESQNSHDEYESVKCYGESTLMVELLIRIMRDPLYKDYNLASMELTCGYVDPAQTDEYVFILFDGDIYIQSAWNGDKPFSNEAKFAVCQEGTSAEIVDMISAEGTDLEIATIKF